MLDYIIGLAIVVLVLAIPAMRRAAFSVLGLVAIAAVGIAGIGLPVWGLYEAKTWLTSDTPAFAGNPPATSDDGALDPDGARGEDTVPPDQEAEQHRLEQERHRLAEEQRRLEEELQRIAHIAEEARSAVENDRKYAQVSASSPRIPGLDRVSTDLIAIRIPPWRDKALADREKDQIRGWLISIGLTPEETASIYTAKGWGSVYDLWRRENAAAVEDDALEGAQSRMQTAQ